MHVDGGGCRRRPRRWRRWRCAGAGRGANLEPEERSGWTLHADAESPCERASHRAVLASRRRGGPVHLRRRRAVRPAVPPDAVLPAGGADVSRRRRSDPWLARAVPVRRKYLQRREADGSARRAGVFREDLAGDRDHPGRVGACDACCAAGGTCASARSCAAGGSAACACSAGCASTPTVPAVTPREIRVTVVNDTPGAAESAVKLDLPQGWTAMPAEQTVKFTRQDESQTVRFQISPAANTAPGDFRVRALVTSTAPTGGAQRERHPAPPRRSIAASR